MDSRPTAASISLAALRAQPQEEDDELRLGSTERFECDEAEQRIRASELEARRANEELKDCTFRPRTSPQSRVPMGLPGDVVQRQALFHERALARREKVRLEEEDEELRECSFHPCVAPKSARITKARCETVPFVENRLMEEGRRMLERQKEREQEKEALEEAAYRGLPTKGKKGKVGPREAANFVARLSAQQNDVKKKAVETGVEETRGICSFKPSINKRSEALCTRRRGQSADPTRLYRKGLEDLKEKEQRLAEQKATTFARECGSFTPSIDPCSAELAVKTRKCDDFVVRQEECAMRSERIKTELREGVAAAEMCSGMKRISSQQLETHISRVFDHAVKMKEELRERLCDEVQRAECPFKPQIPVNHLTKRLVQQEVVERLYTPRSVSRSTSPPQPQQCPPEPQPQPYTARESFTNDSIMSTKESFNQFYTREMQEQSRKREKLSMMQNELLHRDVLSCSFSPKINDSPHPNVRNTPVKGLGSYLKRQEQARSVKQEMEERFNSLGHGKVCNGPNYTVITPFNLSAVGRGREEVRATCTNSSYDSLQSSRPLRQKNQPLRALPLGNTQQQRKKERSPLKSTDAIDALRKYLRTHSENDLTDEA